MFNVDFYATELSELWAPLHLIVFTQSFSSYLAPSVVTVVNSTTWQTAGLGSPETASKARKMEDSHWSRGRSIIEPERSGQKETLFRNT